MRQNYRNTAVFIWEKVTADQSQKKKKAQKALMLLEYMLLKGKWKKGRIIVTIEDLKYNLPNFDNYLATYKIARNAEENQKFLVFWKQICLRTTHRINNDILVSAGLFKYLRINNKEHESFCLAFEKEFINKFIRKYIEYSKEEFLNNLQQYIAKNNQPLDTYNYLIQSLDTYIQRSKEVIKTFNSKINWNPGLTHLYYKSIFFTSLDFDSNRIQLITNLVDYINNISKNNRIINSIKILYAIKDTSHDLILNKYKFDSLIIQYEGHNINNRNNLTIDTKHIIAPNSPSIVSYFYFNKDGSYLKYINKNIFDNITSSIGITEHKNYFYYQFDSGINYSHSTANNHQYNNYISFIVWLNKTITIYNRKNIRLNLDNILIFKDNLDTINGKYSNGVFCINNEGSIYLNVYARNKLINYYNLAYDIIKYIKYLLHNTITDEIITESIYLLYLLKETEPEGLCENYIELIIDDFKNNRN